MLLRPRRKRDRITCPPYKMLSLVVYCDRGRSAPSSPRAGMEAGFGRDGLKGAAEGSGGGGATGVTSRSG
jgi:hypothetical protein